MSKTMISARIPEKLGEELEALATATRRSKAYLVSEALEQYVERQTRLYRAIDEAIKESDQNGQYVSEEDMKAWLLSWGSKDELPPPRLRNRHEPDV